MKSDTIVIIPTYNERENIEAIKSSDRRDFRF